MRNVKNPGCSLLERLIASAGRPAAYLKDGGTDLRKAIRLLDQQGLASPCIDDISHVIANLLKWWYQDQPMLETFLAGASGGFKWPAQAFACVLDDLSWRLLYPSSWTPPSPFDRDCPTKGGDWNWLNSG